MGAGVDPHLYKPSAGDVRTMASAQVLVYNGLHLEGKMTEVLAEMGTRGVETVAVAECVPPEQLLAVEGYDTLHDPHVWFDVGLWAVCRGVSPRRLDSDRSRRTPPGTRSAAMRVITEFAAPRCLGRRDRSRVLPEDRRVLVTAHDAFSYFGRAYGIEVRGLLGVSTAAEAGTADVQALAVFIADRGLPAVFVESSVPPRFVEALTEAVVARGWRCHHRRQSLLGCARESRRSGRDLCRHRARQRRDHRRSDVQMSGQESRDEVDDCSCRCVLYWWCRAGRRQRIR